MESDQQIHNNNQTILSIDQGTTSTRVAVINSNLKILFLEQIEHEQIHQYPGWTEHDPMQIYHNVVTLIDRLHMKRKDVSLGNLVNTYNKSNRHN